MNNNNERSIWTGPNWNNEDAMVSFDAGNRRAIRDMLIGIGILISAQARRSVETYQLHNNILNKQRMEGDALLEDAFDELMDEDFWL